MSENCSPRSVASDTAATEVGNFRMERTMSETGYILIRGYFFFSITTFTSFRQDRTTSKKKDNIHVYLFMFHILLFSCKSFKNDFLFFGYRLARRKKFIASSYSSRNLLQECLLLKLPQDVLFHIMQYLNRVDICTLAQVI